MGINEAPEGVALREGQSLCQFFVLLLCRPSATQAATFYISRKRAAERKARRELQAGNSLANPEPPWETQFVCLVLVVIEIISIVHQSFLLL